MFAVRLPLYALYFLIYVSYTPYIWSMTLFFVKYFSYIHLNFWQAKRLYVKHLWSWSLSWFSSENDVDPSILYNFWRIMYDRHGASSFVLIYSLRVHYMCIVTSFDMIFCYALFIKNCTKRWIPWQVSALQALNIQPFSM